MDGSFDEKAKKEAKLDWYFEPEDIHVMRFNESEEDFEARLGKL